jgi:hypothetical protein
VRCCDSRVGGEGLPRGNVYGLPQFGRSHGVSSGFVLGGPIHRLARVSTRMKKMFFPPLYCVDGNERCWIAEVGRGRGRCSIRWICA